MAIPCICPNAPFISCFSAFAGASPSARAHSFPSFPLKSLLMLPSASPDATSLLEAFPKPSPSSSPLFWNFPRRPLPTPSSVYFTPSGNTAVCISASLVGCRLGLFQVRETSWNSPEHNTHLSELGPGRCVPAFLRLSRLHSPCGGAMAFQASRAGFCTAWGNHHLLTG